MKKCAICGKWIPNEELTEEFCVPYKNNRMVHKDCFNQTVKFLALEKKEELKKKEESVTKKGSKTPKRASKSVPKAELKDGLDDDTYRAKQGFYELVKGIMGVDKLSPKIYAVSEKYITQYDMTWDGMKNTLVYLRDIKEKQLTGDVVGIISYYYEEAQAFYKDVQRVEENNKDVNVNKLYTERVIRIMPHKRKIKQIDIREECN